MKHDAKTNVQQERKEKQNGQKYPEQSTETSIPNLANISQDGIQNLSPAEIMYLQRTIGNRAVTRLMAQRQDDDELQVVPGARNQQRSQTDVARYRAEGGEEEEYEVVPGARTKPMRENAIQQQGGARGFVLESSNESVSSLPPTIGDATDLDGEGLYGWNRVIWARDVRAVVNGVLPNVSTEDIYEPERIVIFSGTHGSDPDGYLINDRVSRGFLAEDQATADATMAQNPDVEIEVIDVMNYTTKDQLLTAISSTNYIRILGWCFSRRSYALGDGLASNWWPDPDYVE